MNAHHINVVYKYDNSKVEVDGPEIIYFENNNPHLIAGHVQDLYDVEILVIFELFDENNLLIHMLEKPFTYFRPMNLIIFLLFQKTTQWNCILKIMIYIKHICQKIMEQISR